MRLFRQLAADRKGVVALMMGIAAGPLAIAVGITVDYAQLVECQTTLQDAVDNAALAGATVYNTSAASSEAVTVATTYVSTASMPASMKLGTPTVTAASGTTNFNGSSYNVTVTTSAKVTVPFLSKVYTSFTISATATASNPIATIKYTAGTFGSSAADWDAVYLYPVPMSNGKPVYNSLPSSSSFYEIGSNCNKSSSNYSSSSMCNGQSGATISSTQTMPTITSTQPVAYVLSNMTYGLSSSSTAATNGYGSQAGHTNYFFSAYEAMGEPPSQGANYSYQSNGRTVTTTYPTASSSLPNCSLTVQQVNSASPPTSPPYQNVCFTDTSSQSGYQYAALSCAAMNGKSYMLWWNDMGGSKDDKDYNDSYFIVSCTVGAGSGTGNTQVVLTN